MASKYVSNTGLSKLFSNLKNYIDSRIQVGGGTQVIEGSIDPFIIITNCYIDSNVLLFDGLYCLPENAELSFGICRVFSSDWSSKFLTKPTFSSNIKTDGKLHIVDSSLYINLTDSDIENFKKSLIGISIMVNIKVNGANKSISVLSPPPDVNPTDYQNVYNKPEYKEISVTKEVTIPANTSSRWYYSSAIQNPDAKWNIFCNNYYDCDLSDHDVGVIYGHPYLVNPTAKSMKYYWEVFNLTNESKTVTLEGNFIVVKNQELPLLENPTSLDDEPTQ